MDIEELILRVRAEIDQAKAGIGSVRADMRSLASEATAAGATMDAAMNLTGTAAERQAGSQRQVGVAAREAATSVKVSEAEKLAAIKLSEAEGLAAVRAAQSEKLTASRLAEREAVAQIRASEAEKLVSVRQNARDAIAAVKAGEKAKQAEYAETVAAMERSAAAQKRLVVQQPVFNTGLASFGTGAGAPSAGELATQNTITQAMKAQTGQTIALTAERKRFNKALEDTRLEVERSQRNPLQNFLAKVNGTDRREDLQRQNPGVPASAINAQMEAEKDLDASKFKQALFGKAIGGAQNVAAGITAIGVASSIMAGQVDHDLLMIKNNTTLTDEQFSVMRQTILKMAADTGTPVVKLGEAYEHISNFGFKNADAMTVLAAANRAARATGADVATTGQVLAKILRENGLSAGDATKMMNLLWVAAANSDTRFAGLVETGGRVFAMSAKLGVSFKETAGVMSLFLSQGLSAAQATTQLQNLESQIIQPKGKVPAVLEKASKISGVDLVGDFSLKGLENRQLSGIFDDIRLAAEKMGRPVKELAADLFPNLRTMIGGLIGTSDAGAQGLNERFKIMGQIMEGLDPIGKNFAAEQRTTTAQMDKLAQSIQVQFLPVGEKFSKVLLEAVPLVKGVADALKSGMDVFLSLPRPIQEAITWLGAFRIATMALGNPLIGGAGVLTGIAKAWNAISTATKGGAGALSQLGMGAGAGEAIAGIGGGAALAELAPFIATLGAAAAGIYLFKIVVDHLGPEVEKTTTQLVNEAKALADHATKSRQSAADILGLATRYQDLHAIAKPTRAELDEMRKVLDQISVLNPSLVTGYDREGHAIGLLGDAVDKLTESYRTLNREKALAAARVTATETQGLREQRDRLNEELQKQKFLLQTHQAVGAGIHPVDVNKYPANFNNPLLMELPGFLPGQQHYAAPNMTSSTPQQESEYAKNIRDLASQIAALDRTTAEHNKTMRDVLGPSGPLRATGGRAGTVSFSHAEDARKVNQQLLTDMRQVAAELGMQIRVGTAITGHSALTTSGHPSRHTHGNAFDITEINGHPANVGDAMGKALADRFVAALEAKGFARNSESGQGKAVLWKTNMGGNHFNHVHVSELPGAGGGFGGDINTSGPAPWKVEKPHKLTPEEKEAAKFKEILGQEQARLTGATLSGSKANEGFMASIVHLTDAHKRQLVAIHDQVTSTNASIDAKKKQAEVEKQFHDRLELANGGIRAARGEELAGIAKLKQEYPGVSEERLKYLQRQEESSKADTQGKANLEKLSKTLSEYKAELADTTPKTGIHKLIMDKLGVSYDTLSQKAKLVAQALFGVKQAIDTKNLFETEQEKADKYLANAKASLELMQHPKDEREVISRLGPPAEALEQWNRATDAMKKNLIVAYQSGKGYEDQEATIKKVTETLAAFHTEMEGRRTSAQASLFGDGAEAQWQKYLATTTQGKILAKATADEIAKARQEFVQTWGFEQHAAEITKAESALKGFNAQMDESIKALQFQKAGQLDTPAGAFAEFLSKNRELSARFQTDTVASADAFQKFKDKFFLEREVQAIDKVRSSMSNVRKELLQLTASSDLDRFKASLLETGKDGSLKQIFSDDQAKQMFDGQEKLKYVKDFADGLRSTLGSAFSDLMKGGKGFFTSLVSGFEQTLQKMASDFLASQFYNLIMRNIGGLFGGAGGGGGASGVGALFSGGAMSGGAGAGAAASIGGGLGDLFQGAFASGGDFVGSRAMLVGENGPELMVPRGSGTIVPSSQLAGAGGISITINVTSPDVNSFKQSQSQMYQDAFAAASRAQSRNGRG